MPALTKNSSVAGTVILPQICGMKNSAQIDAQDVELVEQIEFVGKRHGGSPGDFLHGNHLRAKSHFLSHEPTPGTYHLQLAALEPSFALGVKRIERRSVEAG